MATEATLSSAWDQHLASEFAARSAEQALATMTAEPHVNIVPLICLLYTSDAADD